MSDQLETTPEAIGTSALPNWRDVIEEARKRGGFTDAEKDRAADWLSCACGRLDPRIPKWKTDGKVALAGAPKDPSLRALGVDFSVNVYYSYFGEASSTLDLIEKRERVLLAELDRGTTKEGSV